MLQRQIESYLQAFFAKNKNALLITGARQVGKTYTIRQFGKGFKSFVEINFLENRQARALFKNFNSAKDLLLRISAIANKPLIPGRTLIFFDEVQECPEMVTAIKFLVDEGSYRYILSGSLLGVILKDIQSAPVGYMDIVEMYPLNFAEFALANGVSKDVMAYLQECFLNAKTPDEIVHTQMMGLFRLYLVVGGMPAVVQKYIDTNNIQDVVNMQRGILNLYRKDIAKYDPQEKLLLNEIFALIPSELNAKNKRFILKNLHDQAKFNRYANSFLWLKNSGTALPVYCVKEPKLPLLLSKTHNLFKLFMGDVGLLAAMYMNGIQMDILQGEASINFGAVYENYVAQELLANGFELFYFNSKKQGEIDFVVEYKGAVLPIEVKSGKDYQRHNALANVLEDKNYNILRAFVFHNGTVEKKDKICYYPIYMLMFLAPQRDLQSFVFKPKVDALM